MTQEQRAHFIANIPDIDARREAEKLWLASEGASQALAEACIRKGVSVANVDGKALEEIGSEFEAAIATDAELSGLHATAEAALSDWIAVTEYGEPLSGDDGEAIRCALTGFLIHETDFYLIDIRTHEAVLKSALGLPLGAIVGEFRADPDSITPIICNEAHVTAGAGS